MMQKSRWIGSRASFNTTDFALYVTCFCESGYLLSQWRAYGADHGYAIEVDANGLRDLLDDVRTDPNAAKLIQVGYGEEAAFALVSELFSGTG